MYWLELNVRARINQGVLELNIRAQIKCMGWNSIKGLKFNKRAGMKCMGLN